MAGLIADASVLLEVLGNTSRSDAASAALRGTELVAPELVDLEVSSTLARWERAGDRTPAQVAAAFEAYQRLPIMRRPLRELMTDAWGLRRALRVTDAFYVALARSLARPLITTDARLARVARDQSLCEVVVVA